jgi:hypothetical protein
MNKQSPGAMAPLRRAGAWRLHRVVARTSSAVGVLGLVVGVLASVIVVGAPAGATATTWTPTTAPLSGLSPAAGTNPDVVLNNMSCPAAGSCVAVENYTDSSGNQQGLIETLSGGSWSATTAPLTGLSPAAGTNPDVFLNGMSCPVTGSCVAVGYYLDSSSNHEGLIETLSGGSWSATTAPLTGLSPAPGTNPNVDLLGMSCPATGSCVAVGGYTDSSGNQQGLIETLSSGSWSATTAPVSGLSPAAGTNPGANLNIVSCPATGSCVAVGYYLDSSSDHEGLIETLSGGSWSATTAPVSGLSPAAQTNPNVDLLGMSCPASGSCVVVGVYLDSLGTLQGLIETLSGGSWSATTAPVSGLSPAAGTPSFVALLGVSCPATGSCVAVGDYTDSSAGGQGLIETLSGGSWSATTAPVSGLSPATHPDPQALFRSVSCPATGSCVAVGGYTDSSGNQQGLIETLSSGSWSATTAPVSGLSPAAGTNPGANLNIVSCPATGSCVAVGYYLDSSSDHEGLIETQAVTPTPPPPTPPAPPPPPSGATSSSNCTSSSTSGTCDTTNAGTTVSASGFGSLTLSQYSSDPVGSPTFSSAGEYFDLQIASGSSFTSLTADDCNLNGGTGLQWWNPQAAGGAGAWEPVVPTSTYTAGPPACVSTTFDSASSPTLAQLTGTVFGVSSSPTPVTLTQGPPTSATVAQGAGFSGQLTVTNATGTVSYAETSSLYSTEVVVTSTGAISAATSLAPGVYTVSGTDGDTNGDTGTWTFTLNVTPPGPPPPPTPTTGYWLVANDGGIFSFGNAGFFGSTGNIHLNQPIVGMASTPDSQGYWLVASDGGIFAFGDAGFFGSTGAMHLNKPIVGMTSTPDGKGYWLVASDGGIFAFGDAGFFGSTGAQHLNQPVVGMTSTADGKGYWFVASDGGIFAFGDAGFFGSTGAIHLNQPVVGMTSTPDSRGYWMVASDGGIFAFGNAGFFGSTGNIHLNQPVVGMTSTSDGRGYWFVASDGGVFAFGNAPFNGSMGGTRLNQPVVGMAAT